MSVLKLYGAPGTGKTTELLRLVELELRTTTPARIAFLTFTRAARLEALSRIHLTEEQVPYMRTIHAICYRELKIARDQIVTAKALGEFGREVNLPLSGRQFDPWVEDAYGRGWEQPTEGDTLIQWEHLRRHRGVSEHLAWQLAPRTCTLEYLRWFSQSYQAWKRREALLDYTDLLEAYLQRGRPLPVDAAFVDEAQDLSWLQWQVVGKLRSEAARTYLAGDDDQAIFTWAGASARRFNQHEADEVVVLPRSYRVPRKIWDLAQRVIARVPDRQPKEVAPRDADGEVRELGVLEVKEDTLVLYRNGFRGHKLADQLIEAGLPYSGLRAPLEHEGVRQALVAWHDLATGRTIKNTAARTLVSVAARNWLQPDAATRLGVLSEVRAGDLFKHEVTLDPSLKALPQLPYGGYVRQALAGYGWASVLRPTTRLLSIHQAKGREAATVVLDTMLARKTYDSYLQAPEDEHRVFYVAVTRARERLWTLLPDGVMNYEL